MQKLMSLEVADNVGLLRFLKPEQRNPFGLEFIEEFVSSFDEAAKRDDIRALVMTGGAHFCAGGDLPAFQGLIANGPRGAQELLEAVNSAARAAYKFPKPLVAAVNGACFGAGMGLALCADFIVCAEDARFCQVFARIGACPDTGSSWLLQQRVGAAMARLLTFTGREIDGLTAVDMGVADRAVAASDTEREAKALAAEIAVHPQFGIKSTKRVLREVASVNFDEALEIEGAAQTTLFCAHDLPEAMAAFTEGRKPKYLDR